MAKRGARPPKHKKAIKNREDAMEEFCRQTKLELTMKDITPPFDPLDEPDVILPEPKFPGGQLFYPEDFDVKEEEAVKYHFRLCWDPPEEFQPEKTGGKPVSDYRDEIEVIGRCRALLKRIAHRPPCSGYRLLVAAARLRASRGHGKTTTWPSLWSTSPKCCVTWTRVCALWTR